MKKFLALLLVTVMAVGFMPPTTASAEEVGVTLQEAQQSPGVYVKRDNMFVPVSQQYHPNEYYQIRYSFGSGLFQQYEETRNDVRWLYPAELQNSFGSPLVVISSSDYEIPKISKEDQLVLVGIDSADVYHILSSGWTIPYGIEWYSKNDYFELYHQQIVDLEEPTFLSHEVRNLGMRELIDLDERELEDLGLANYSPWFRMLEDQGIDELMDVDAIADDFRNTEFATVNGIDIASFQENLHGLFGENWIYSEPSRMDDPDINHANYATLINDEGKPYELMPFYYVLNASPNEEFVLGGYDGTEWKELRLKADKRYFVTSGENNLSEDYEIVKTKDGYFELNFFTPPTGYYRIGRSDGGIIEFTDGIGTTVTETKTPSSETVISSFDPNIHVSVTEGSSTALVDGKEVSMAGLAPYRTAREGASFMVPIRFVSEMFGVKTEDTRWEQSSGTFTMSVDENTVQFIRGANYYKINGKEYPMMTGDIKVFSESDPVSGSMYVPFRYVGQAFGIPDGSITYDAATKTAEYNR